MIGYVTIGVADVDKAKAFYLELLAELGATVVMDAGRIAMLGKSMAEPMLAVCTPYDEQQASPGNGSMFAIPAPDKPTVDRLYQKAISLGATCEGEPGQRLPDVFYGAYFRDPDGNKGAFYVFG